VKKHQQGVGAAFGDLTTSCAEIQSELDALEPQWRAWVATLQKKVAAARDVDAKRSAASAASDAAKDAAASLRDAEALAVKASSHYDKACHLADLGASLRDAVHARDAKKETLDRVAQDAGTGGRRSRRDITRDLKRLQDEKEAAVNKRAQVNRSVFVTASALTVRERRGGAIHRRSRDGIEVDTVAAPSTRLTDTYTGGKRQGRGFTTRERHDFPEGGSVESCF
jgi:hypothetical protein